METSKEEQAASYRDILQSEKNFAQSRCSALADDFTKLEVEIATLLIAFAGISLNSLTRSPAALKIVYALGVFLLIISLAIGLIHIKRKEKFWHEVMNAKFVARKKWMSALEKIEISFEEAQAFQAGTNLEKGNIIYTPSWTWILQTTCLGLAFLLFFILFLALLF